MAKVVRRAAKKAIITVKDNHSLLSLFLFDEKIVCQNLRKLVDSMENASLSLLKWARQEDNLALEDVFSKGVEVGSIWAALLKQYGEKHIQYRSAFKEILQEERTLDDIRKSELNYASKLNKLQKQVDQNKRRSGVHIHVTKSKSVMEEMAEILSMSEEAHAELEVKITKHEILKAEKLRNALYLKSEAIESLAKQSLSVSKSYKELADLIPDTPTQLSESKLYPGAGQARRIVTDLVQELKLDPIVVADGAGKSDHTYLYAVSPLKPKQPTESSPTPLPDLPGDIRQRIQSTVSADFPRKISDESLSNQRFGHPLSLDDLRPPPSCPPPPLPTQARQSPSKQPNNLSALLKIQQFGKPLSMEDLRASPSSRPRIGPPATRNRLKDRWYARSKAIDDSDSDDSDDYTEPYVEPTQTQFIVQTDSKGYKSLTRAIDSDRYTGIHTEICPSVDVSKVYGHIQPDAASSQTTNYQPLNSNTDKVSGNSVHYDGSYLELIQ